MKRLPPDDQPFPTIIDQGLLYADKTRYIYEMLNDGYRCYFLSRPPRFGKTLLLQTLKELFTGNRARFKGLWIDQSDYDFKAYPTISLTLDLPSDSPETLETAFNAQLQGIAQAEDLDVSGPPSSMSLSSLIQDLSRKRQSQVAVLLDDFDAPVTNHMANPSLVKAHTEFLSYLFGAFKTSYVQSCLGFFMVTGIASYDSTLAGYYVVDLKDISLHPKYAGIGGFTLEEFNALFADRLEATLAELKDKGPKGSGAMVKKAGGLTDVSTVDDLRAKIIKWYGGYRWGGETRVLNPYSTLHFFSHKAFDSYWINSVRPGLLDVLIKAKPKGFLEFALESPPPLDMENMELDKSEPARFLIRSGYLTLDDSLDEEVSAWKDSLLDDAEYFQFPNYEVASNFIKECFTALFSFMSSNELKTIAVELKKALLSRKTAIVQDILTGFIRPLSPYLGTAYETTFIT
ncbi:MAG: AAA family ATPase, partial [Deltaproteobacteria bacterium]|nr:AAA family ATPase [Deltaproteobacteria bacterium]